MRRKKGCSCINLKNGVDAWSRKIWNHASLFGCEGGRRRIGPRDVVIDDEGTRFCGERSPARRPATAHQKRTDAQTVLLFFLFCLIHPAFQSIRLDQVSPTLPSGFSWSSSWTAASFGFWHVPARSGRSAAGPWNRTGSSNSCCGLGSAPR